MHDMWPYIDLNSRGSGLVLFTYEFLATANLFVKAIHNIMPAVSAKTTLTRDNY
jgi:hypothetical protein